MLITPFVFSTGCNLDFQFETPFHLLIKILILVILLLIFNKPAWPILVSVSAYYLDLFPCVFHILNFELGTVCVLFVLVKLQNLKHSASNNN